MAFAIVHFTVGFVSVLALLWLVPITRYRLTGAFLGGGVALVPDAGKLFDGRWGMRFQALHDSGSADLFFLHATFDGPAFRAHNIELTFLSLSALGVGFLLYDWRFGHTPSTGLSGSTDAASRDHGRL
ncbi:MAG: hypothetical protein R6V31_07285 [Halohasta sp.]